MEKVIETKKILEKLESAPMVSVPLPSPAIWYFSHRYDDPNLEYKNWEKVLDKLGEFTKSLDVNRF